jgi:hypothetical protein
LEPIVDKSYPEMEDQWIEDLMLCADIMEHMQTLNLGLQGEDAIIIPDIPQTALV